jgi:hypothetical protein
MWRKICDKHVWFKIANFEMLHVHVHVHVIYFSVDIFTRYGNGCINPLTLNGHYSDRTAPLTSRRRILNIYSTNIRTEYFKHAT